MVPALRLTVLSRAVTVWLLLFSVKVPLVKLTLFAVPTVTPSLYFTLKFLISSSLSVTINVVPSPAVIGISDRINGSFTKVTFSISFDTVTALKVSTFAPSALNV